MSITNKQAFQAAKTLKAFCEARNHECRGCFFSMGVDCMFECEQNPHLWELPILPRWTETDKEYARVFMKSGVKSARRLGTGYVMLIDNEGETLMLDHMIRTFNLFKCLNTNEIINLEEIVNSEGVLEE